MESLCQQRLGRREIKEDQGKTNLECLDNSLLEAWAYGFEHLWDHFKQWSTLVVHDQSLVVVSHFCASIYISPTLCWINPSHYYLSTLPPSPFMIMFTKYPSQVLIDQTSPNLDFGQSTLRTQESRQLLVLLRNCIAAIVKCQIGKIFEYSIQF